MANVAAGYVLHIHTPLQKELKMWKKKLIFKSVKEEFVSPKRTQKHQTLTTLNNFEIKRSF